VTKRGESVPKKNLGVTPKEPWIAGEHVSNPTSWNSCDMFTCKIMADFEKPSMGIIQ